MDVKTAKMSTGLAVFNTLTNLQKERFISEKFAVKQAEFD